MGIGRAAAGAALVLLVALAGIGCGSSPPPAAPVATVGEAVVRRATLTRVVTAEAVLYPLQQAVLTPKISAPVDRFYVNRGDRVRQGELVAVLDNRDLKAAVLQAQGAYEQAQAGYLSLTGATLPEQVRTAQLNLASAQQALDAARRIYQSRRNLYAQGALPRITLDQAHVAYAQAEAAYREAEQKVQRLTAVGRTQQLRAAAGRVAAAQGQYQAAQAQLAYSYIRSPINGVVASRPVYPGELATTSAPLMTIMNLRSVVARAHLSQQQAALVQVGDRATLAAPGGTRARGAVTVVSPAVDPNSTTVQIWAQAPNPALRLRPGSAVALSIRAGQVANAVVVPAVALLTDSLGAQSVLVVVHDVAEQRAVSVGVEQGGEAQILRGLQPGETVVTTGAFGLPSGTRVQPAPQGGAASGAAGAAPKGD
ncbi:MAG: efflux RND transporter periplasmic adaptor subunit [Terriglobales bacterium]